MVPEPSSVALIGVDSVRAPTASRVQAWARLAKNLDRRTIADIAKRIGLADAIEAAPKILSGSVRGRLVVDVNA